MGLDLRGRLKAWVADLGSELGERETRGLRALAEDEVPVGSSPCAMRFDPAHGVPFRLQQGRAAFGLLYELNSQHLLIQVAGRLRRYGSKADPRDVLQEVFFNSLSLSPPLQLRA
jgi:hypothetical protein